VCIAQVTRIRHIGVRVSRTRNPSFVAARVVIARINTTRGHSHTSEVVIVVQVSPVVAPRDKRGGCSLSLREESREHGEHISDPRRNEVVPSVVT